MKVLPILVALAFAACGTQGATLTAAEAEPVVTSVASGKYQTLWLQIEQGGISFDNKTKDRFDVPLFLGLRDGKAVVAWFAHPAMSGARVVWVDSATLKLSGEQLKGSLAGRTNLHWGDKNVRDYEYTFDASIRSSREIVGNFAARFVDDSGEKIEFSGRLNGGLPPSEQAAADKLPPGQNWPHYYGAGFRLAGPPGESTLIDDLARARPVWKSEAYIPTAYGSAPDNRYPDRAGRAGNGGGASSPVVAEGRVYQFFYYPRGPVGQSRAYIENFIQRPFTSESDLLAKARELFPKREVQQQAVLNHFRTQADEVLVCLDASTGQTLWRTTFPQRGNNYQTHKHRGHFPTPLVAKGVVYQPGTTGRLYAVDAITGQLRWEYPDDKPQAHMTTDGGINSNAPSPVHLDGVVAYAASGRVYGVDAQSGSKRWETPLWHRSSLLPWKEAGKSLLIASDRDHQEKQNYAVALDATSGTVIWRVQVDYLTDFAFPLLSGNLLIGYSLDSEMVKPGENDGLAKIHAYQISADGLKPAWTTPPLAPIIDTIGLAIDGERVYVSTARKAFCLKLATGEQLAQVENVGGARTQTAFVACGRWFIQPEGRHGSQSFLMLSADPASFRAFPATQPGDAVNHQVGGEFQWRPPHTWTTAYANQPIVYPLIDGRLLVRGLDAIYCYDLRSKSDAH